MKLTKNALTVATGVFAISTSAQAVTQIQVTVNNTGNVGFAPAIVSFSDGSYDIFTPGTTASAALEDLAETGSPAGFSPPSGGPVFGNNPAPPIFTPGGSNSTVFSVANGDSMFNFAAMILPSNDWFIGNAVDYDVSSLLGAANGTSLTFLFSSIYDAGTELEDFAFSPGNPIVGASGGGGAADFGADQNGVVELVSNPDFTTFLNAPSGLDNSLFLDGGPYASVTLEVIPEPSTSLLGGFALAAGLLRRRRA